MTTAITVPIGAAMAAPVPVIWPITRNPTTVATKMNAGTPQIHSLPPL
jgi:hypothetical protein